MTPRCARPTWAKASPDAAHLISRVVLFLSGCLILSRAHDSAIVRAGEILPCRIFFLASIIEATSGKKTTRSQEIQRRKGESCENQVCATVGAGRRSCCFLSVPSRNCVLAGSGGQRSRSALRHPGRRCSARAAHRGRSRVLR